MGSSFSLMAHQERCYWAQLSKRPKFLLSATV